MIQGKAQKRQVNPETLRKDWMNLGLSSGLFSLVAKKTMPRKALGKYENRLSRLTVNQVKIFGHIVVNCDSEIRVKQLAHDLDITPAAASQAIDRLVSVGMVERKQDSSDRRSFIITISRQGHEILDEYREMSNRLLSEIYGEIDVTLEELAAFSKVMAAIHGSLRARWAAYLKEKDGK